MVSVAPQNAPAPVAAVVHVAAVVPDEPVVALVAVTVVPSMVTVVERLACKPWASKTTELAALLKLTDSGLREEPVVR